MPRFDLKSLVDRMFPPLLIQTPAPIHAANTSRRCPDCFAAYEPARHRYCPQCSMAVPEWRYG